MFVLKRARRDVFVPYLENISSKYGDVFFNATYHATTISSPMHPNDVCQCIFLEW